MLIFVKDDMLRERFNAFHGGASSELIDFSRALQQSGMPVFWGSMKALDMNQRTISLVSLSNKTYQQQTIFLDTLQTLGPICLFKYIGSVESQRALIQSSLTLLESHYQGTVINNPQTMAYGLEKHYLLELQKAGFSCLPTKIYDTSMTLEMLRCDGFEKSNTIIKPLTGELSNSVSMLADIDDAWLARKRDRVGGWLVQPFSEDIWRGEFQIVFLADEISHGVHKNYFRKQGMTLPSQQHREILPYTPTDSEIQLGLEIKKYFESTLSKPLKYFRLDFMKNEDGAPCVLEVEMVNPGFFYQYQPEDIKQKVCQQFVAFITRSVSHA